MQTIIIGFLVGILLLLGIWFVLKRNREHIESATENVGVEDTGDGEEEETHTKGGASIPISKRAHALSTTAKVMFGSMALLVIVMGFFIYRTIQTGSPSEVMFADQLSTAVKVLIGACVGIIGHSWSRKNEGEVINIYEGDSGTEREEKIPIDISNVDADSTGRKVVTEYKKRRVLGLFRRYKHVAEDPKLEGTHRAPGKTITHQIADHAVYAGDGVWIQRTTERNVAKTPDTEADYIYSSPIELDYEDYIDAKQSKRRMGKRLDGAEATIAVLEREFEKLIRRLKSGRYKEREELLGEVERVADIVQPDDHEQPSSPDTRSTRVDISKNGDSPQKEVSAAANGDGGSK